jgi:hypothetical protein
VLTSIVCIWHCSCHFRDVSIQRARKETKPTSPYQHCKLRENNDRQWIYTKVWRGAAEDDLGSSGQYQGSGIIHITTQLANETSFESGVVKGESEGWLNECILGRSAVKIPVSKGQDQVLRHRHGKWDGKVNNIWEAPYCILLCSRR